MNSYRDRSNISWKLNHWSAHTIPRINSYRDRSNISWKLNHWSAQTSLNLSRMNSYRDRSKISWKLNLWLAQTSLNLSRMNSYRDRSNISWKLNHWSAHRSPRTRMLTSIGRLQPIEKGTILYGIISVSDSCRWRYDNAGILFLRPPPPPPPPKKTNYRNPFVDFSQSFKIISPAKSHQHSCIICVPDIWLWRFWMGLNDEKWLSFETKVYFWRLRNLIVCKCHMDSSHTTKQYFATKRGC